MILGRVPRAAKSLWTIPGLESDKGTGYHSIHASKHELEVSESLEFDVQSL